MWLNVRPAKQDMRKYMTCAVNHQLYRSECEDAMLWFRCFSIRHAENCWTGLKHNMAARCAREAQKGVCWKTALNGRVRN